MTEFFTGRFLLFKEFVTAVLFLFSVCLSLSGQASNKLEFAACDQVLPRASHDSLSDSDCLLVPRPLRAGAEEVIHLFIRRFPARTPAPIGEAQGNLWLIAGGPGESGASFYKIIDTYRNRFPHLDIIVPDHRGTGASSTICPAEQIESDAGTALAGAEWGACFSHMYANVDYVKSFSITNAARDLKYLVETVGGTGEQYLYGVSYGTQLVLRTMQLTPKGITGIILDSLVPLQDDVEFDLSQRSHIVNKTGIALLTRCDKSANCKLKGEPSLKVQLRTALDHGTRLTDFDRRLPAIDVTVALGSLLDIPAARRQIPALIRQLYGLGKSSKQPNAAEVARINTLLSDAQTHYLKLNPGYMNFGSSIPLAQVITASENNLRPTLKKSEVATEASEMLFTSPLPGLIAENSMPSYERDDYFAAQPAMLPPTLILQGGRDPKTPLAGAVRHAKQLSKLGEVRLVEIVDAPHFIALNAPTCFHLVLTGFANAAETAIEATIDECTDEAVAIGF